MMVPAATCGAARRPVLAADVDAAGAAHRVDGFGDDAVAAKQRFGAARYSRPVQFLQRTSDVAA